MRQIGKYQVKERIGVGGFGEVFKGFDPFIKRHVAIKTCSSRSEEIRSRFFQEAEISGNLNHKNITTIHDFGIEGDLPYLVQEYLSGEDLDEKIKRRDALPYAEKLFYLIQIARGLAHAHQHGVIHRDIKPANVRILEDGTTKIMDFGIAKLAQHESGLTQTGMTLGTAAYLSPEQIRGEDVDQRTDIFSFGVLSYELLSYQRPFKGNQISAVLYQLLHHEPQPLQELWPDAPAELSAVISRCLVKQQADRFDDATALLHALEGLQWTRGESDSGGAVGTTVGTTVPAAHSPPAQPPAEAGPPPAGGGPTLSLDDSMAGLASGPPTLDDVEISTAMVEAPEVSDTMPVIAGHAEQASPSRLPAVLAILILAAVAGAGGWWFGTRPGDDPAAPTQGEVDATTLDEASQTDGGHDAIDVAPSTPSAGETATEEQNPAAQLEKGMLTVPKPTWTDQMTVRLGGGAARTLDRGRSYELAPGDYRLTFGYADGAFKLEKTVAVSLGEGAKKRLPPPLPAPGAITVRPQLGRAQGEVFIDGLPRGPSPLRRQLLEPGDYLVEVRPREGGEGITLQVGVKSATMAILTFDLDAGKMQRADKPLNLR